MMALAQNKDFNVKYVYHEELHNETMEPINFNESSIYDFVTDKKPLCYHVYNMKRNKHYQNTLPFFYKIYNISAMKMHQLAQHVGGCVKAIFTDTIIVENPKNKPILSTDIGGVRISKFSESELVLEKIPRTKNLSMKNQKRKY